MSWDVRRADSRAVTSTDWLHSAHSFAFGPHYDPANLSFGPLLVLNVDEVQPGDGYVRHRHAGVEILTWVLAGTLEHVDASGNRLLRPGTLQYLSAGSGIEHAERSGSAVEPVRVVQMWLAPTGPAGVPSYRAVELELGPDELLLAASASRPAPIRLRQPAAELYLARLTAGTTVRLPAAPLLHLFLITGAAVVREGTRRERLAAEDAVRITGASDVGIEVEQGCELLAWAMAAG